jgi:hypothetical protein
MQRQNIHIPLLPSMMYYHRDPLGEEADTDLMILDLPAQAASHRLALPSTTPRSLSRQRRARPTSSLWMVRGRALPGSGLFTITVGCVPLTEQNCSDGIATMRMVWWTAKDSADCLPGSAECPLDHCVADWTLYCDSVDSWTTLNPGATDTVDNYDATPSIIRVLSTPTSSRPKPRAQ